MNSVNVSPVFKKKFDEVVSGRWVLQASIFIMTRPMLYAPLISVAVLVFFSTVLGFSFKDMFNHVLVVLACSSVIVSLIVLSASFVCEKDIGVEALAAFRTASPTPRQSYLLNKMEECMQSGKMTRVSLLHLWWVAHYPDKISFED